MTKDIDINKIQKDILQLDKDNLNLIISAVKTRQNTLQSELAIKFSVGMKVNFGKTRGKQYVGIVTKVNSKRAEVQMDTGGFARVPYSLMREAI